VAALYWDGWDGWLGPLTPEEHECATREQLAANVASATHHDRTCEHHYDVYAPEYVPQAPCSCDYMQRAMFRYANAAKLKGFA
jgi:hypothetical protein